MDQNSPQMRELKYLATLSPSSTSRAWQSAVHPTRNFIATACADKTVRIYSLSSFTLLSTITGGHKRTVRCCAWKPSLPSAEKSLDSVLATGSFDATAAIWVGHPPIGEQDRDCASDGSHLDDEGGFRYAVVLEGHDSEIKSIAWSAHGTYLATCSRDKSVWIWEALETDGTLNGSDDEDNYETVAVMQEHDGDVKCVAWHPSEEQCLASASYDEQVRIWREDIDGEWGCVAVCAGHKGTVWCVAWEPWGKSLKDVDGVFKADAKGPESGPRLISCSDDLSIRIWKRKAKNKQPQASNDRIPSIIRSSSDEEEWHEDSQLPRRHERAIYGVAWSKTSHRVVSCGSDGRIVVYQEQIERPQTLVSPSLTEDNRDWIVVADIDGAHGIWEVNSVTWAQREEQEVVISTGDDGEVKVWTIE